MYDINLMRFYKKIEFFKDPNEMKEEKDVYTFEEFQKYITGASNLNDKTMFEMLYYCGLRRGECRGLQWSDIDWNNKLVSITKQANSVKDSQKYYELTPPKTQKSIRTLPLTDVLYNDLVNLYNEKKKYYGFNENDYMAFGDQENDLEMLENAKIGIAVKDIDGSEKLQHMADYVCDAPRKDGIYTFLKNNGYI